MKLASEESLMENQLHDPDLKIVEIDDLVKLPDILEDVDHEKQKLVLDMRGIPEVDMQVRVHGYLNLCFT